MRRPENHVTRAMAANRIASGHPHPDVDPRLVEALEKQFPPRCKAPGESLEEHMHYSGSVYLISLLRQWSNEMADFSETGLEPEEDD
jgi:hypothetical protein